MALLLQILMRWTKCFANWMFHGKNDMGLGADGASVIAGERNGLRSYVEKENPYCTYVHCVCHRLNLSVSQACKSFPEMEAVRKILTGVYNYINHSPKKHQEFKEIAALLETDIVKFKKMFEVRWLSMGESVVAVIKNFEPLTVFLGHEANTGEPLAVGLLHQLTSFLYLSLIYLTADILTATNHLSRIFQFRDVSFGAIQGSVSNCTFFLKSWMKVSLHFCKVFLLWPSFLANSVLLWSKSGPHAKLKQKYMYF